MVLAGAQRKWVWTSLIVLAGLVLPIRVVAQHWGPIIGPHQPAVFKLVAEVRKKEDGTLVRDTAGSGFIVGRNGDALTAAHNVPDERGDERYVVKYCAYFSSRTSECVEAELVGEPERELDVARLRLAKVGGKEWHAVELSADVPAEHSPLYAVGFAGEGEVGGAHGTLNNYIGKGGRWQTSIPFNPGYSGAPVFDPKGRVVAMAVAGNYPAEQAVTFVRGVRDISSYIDLARLQADRNRRALALTVVRAVPISVSEHDRIYRIDLINTGESDVFLSQLRAVWLYKAGGLAGIERALVLEATQKYSITLNVDIGKTGRLAGAVVPIRDLVVLRPGNVHPFDLKVLMQLVGRFDYHPSPNWGLFFAVFAETTDGHTVSLVQESWRPSGEGTMQALRYGCGSPTDLELRTFRLVCGDAKRLEGEKLVHFGDLPHGPARMAEVQIDQGRRVFRFLRGQMVTLTVFGADRYRYFLYGDLPKVVVDLKGLRRLGPNDSRVFADLTNGGKVTFVTPLDQESCEFELQGVRIRTEGEDALRGGEAVSFSQGDLTRLPAGRKGVAIGLPEGGRIEIEWSDPVTL